MSKIKKSQQKIKVNCTNCFKSNHVVFNFGYITYAEDFDEYAKQTLMERLIEVSNVNYIELMRWGRYKGIEEERLEIRKEIPSGFNQEIEEFDGKYSVMRIYKSNNPTPGRIIGKLVNKVFYIFYIDTKGVLYNHGS